MHGGEHRPPEEVRKKLREMEQKWNLRFLLDGLDMSGGGEVDDDKKLHPEAHYSNCTNGIYN